MNDVIATAVVVTINKRLYCPLTNTTGLGITSLMRCPLKVDVLRDKIPSILTSKSHIVWIRCIIIN